MNVLFGGFIVAEGTKLSAEEVAAAERLLDESDPDIVDWILGRVAPPPALETLLLARIRRYADGEPRP